MLTGLKLGKVFMKKGVAYKFVFFSVAVIFAAALFAVMGSFLLSGMIETRIAEKTVQSKINVGSAAYVIEECLSEGKDYIEAEKLDRVENICSLCRVCGVDKFCAKITDISIRPVKVWKFGCELDDDPEKTAEISVNIKYPTGRIGLGKMEVSII